MTKMLLAAAGLALLAATPVNAAPPCKDAKGKFMKCPVAAKAAPARCRLNGKFAKCGTPGAKAI